MIMMILTIDDENESHKTSDDVREVDLTSQTRQCEVATTMTSWRFHCGSGRAKSGSCERFIELVLRKAKEGGEGSKRLLRRSRRRSHPCRLVVVVMIVLVGVGICDDSVGWYWYL